MHPVNDMEVRLLNMSYMYLQYIRPTSLPNSSLQSRSLDTWNLLLSKQAQSGVVRGIQDSHFTSEVGMTLVLDYNCQHTTIRMASSYPWHIFIKWPQMFFQSPCLYYIELLQGFVMASLVILHFIRGCPCFHKGMTFVEESGCIYATQHMKLKVDISFTQHGVPTEQMPDEKPIPYRQMESKGQLRAISTIKIYEWNKAFHKQSSPSVNRCALAEQKARIRASGFASVSAQLDQP